MDNRQSSYRRPATDEARERANSYQRQYRRANPDRVREWRERYIVRKAAQIAAERCQDGLKGGDGQ